MLRAAVLELLLALACLGPWTALGADEPDFSFVIFPDTQYMVQRRPEIWDSMCRWVVDNKAELNIKAVISVGDITNSAGEREFERASAGYGRIEAAGIACLPILGNHDYDWLVLGRSASKFDRWFGPDRFGSKDYYGGNHAGSNANYFIRLAVGKRRFLILALELYPRPEAVAWAAGVIDSNPDHELILATHAYLRGNGRRVGRFSLGGPGFYLLPAADSSGEELWNKLVRRKSGIRAVVSGHYGREPHAALWSEAGDSGNLVHQILVDFQHRPNGGDGWLGLWRFRPGRAELSFHKTWAPSGLGPQAGLPVFDLAWP